MPELAEQPRHKIGEVAALVGVTPRTIRYYEELGLLGETGEARPKGAHRLYGDGEVSRLRELVRLRDLLGLSLEELTELAVTVQAGECLRDRWAGSSDDAERAQIIRASIPNVRRQLELVDTRRRAVEEFERDLKRKLARMQELLAELEA